MYNFDEVIPRDGSRCIKIDKLNEYFGRTDLISLWIADMDFRTPDFVIDALKARLEHPIFGYYCPGNDYFEQISQWLEKLHNWKVDPDDIRFIPGIVKGIGFVERCFLAPGDKVIIQSPVYHPYNNVTTACGFEVVKNPLLPIYDNEGFLCGFHMDLEGLKAMIDDRTKFLLLCNPHNPGGICFSEQELKELASICKRHNIIVVADEIIAEMILGGRKHIPFASVSEDAAECSISFMAPSKTFNIAGIVSSYCIIHNSELKQKFFDYIKANEIDSPSIFSAEATRACYTDEGLQWRSEMLNYIESNIDFVDNYLRSNIPQIRALRPQAAFMVWLDCRKLGLEQKDLVDLFVNKAHLALNDGTMFGEEGSGFMRLNVASPKKLLQEALENLKEAVKTL